MTTLLYLERGSEQTLSAYAHITETLQTPQGLALVLDQSPFYPEGGGQPSDRGSIGNVQVTDVQTIDGKVLHFVESLPEDAATYLCQVDALRRKDLSVQHSGQHMLSAIVFDVYDAKTVGFHLSETYTTIDLDVKLSPEDIRQIENRCFEVIASGLTVRDHYPSQEELESLPLRKQPKVSEDIRVIEIAGLDYSPCGGTHVSTTNEIMGLKITKFENYKGGTRLEFVCGQRFIAHIQAQSQILDQLSQKFSSPIDQLLTSADKREQQMEQLKKQNQELMDQIIEAELNEWLSSLTDAQELGFFSPVHIRQYENRPLEELKKLSQRFTEVQEQVAILLISRQDTMSQFVFSRPKGLDSINCKLILQKASEKFQTKGGGAPQGVQGSLVDSEQTDAFIEYIEELIQ